jgi:hypothetical protein
MTVWLYHITSLENLPAILRSGQLLSKNALDASQSPYTTIAYEQIQERRAQKIVPCGPGGVLHDYVPFYFAPRSPMLYAISKGLVQGYGSGQSSILHLLIKAEDIFAESLDFSFTDGHAIIGYSRFYDRPSDLNEAIDWAIMKEKYWNDTDEDGDRKRRRQAEFLVHRAVPWPLIRAICVMDEERAGQVHASLHEYHQQTAVKLRPNWYY